MIRTLPGGHRAAHSIGDGDYVISADEKTSIQARCRCHPPLPPGLARRMRVATCTEFQGVVHRPVDARFHRSRLSARMGRRPAFMA
jgi:hypothetical protein